MADDQDTLEEKTKQNEEDVKLELKKGEDFHLFKEFEDADCAKMEYKNYNGLSRN